MLIVYLFSSLIAAGVVIALVRRRLNSSSGQPIHFTRPNIN
jgi:hypothetical protein